jgi:CDP-diacylglycerol--serine O-phosphatidyltransferase
VLLFRDDVSIISISIVIFLGILFDLLDGLFARKLNIQTKLGLELDSLADLITSGLVPGIIMFNLITNALKINLDEITILSFDTYSIFLIELIPYLGFIITLSSAYRLANFNLIEDNKNFFVGLPVPANTLLILSLFFIAEYSQISLISNLLENYIFLIFIVFISSFLLNSRIKLISLKFKNLRFNKENNFRYILIVLSIISLLLFKYYSIPLILFLYLIVSKYYFKKN